MGDFISSVSEEARGLLITIALLIVAATAHTLVQYSNAKADNKEFTRIDFFVSLIIAMFTAWMFGLFTDFVTDNDTAIRLGVGIGGYLGVVGMNRLGIWFLERFGLAENSNDTE